MATGDPHNLGFGGCWCGGNHGMTLTERSYANGYRDGKAEDYDALRARHAALVAAVTDFILWWDMPPFITDDDKLRVEVDALRAALASEEAG